MQGFKDVVLFNAVNILIVILVVPLISLVFFLALTSNLGGLISSLVVIVAFMTICVGLICVDLFRLNKRVLRGNIQKQLIETSNANNIQVMSADQESKVKPLLELLPTIQSQKMHTNNVVPKFSGQFNDLGLKYQIDYIDYVAYGDNPDSSYDYCFELHGEAVMIEVTKNYFTNDWALWGNNSFLNPKVLTFKQEILEICPVDNRYQDDYTFIYESAESAKKVSSLIKSLSENSHLYDDHYDTILLFKQNKLVIFRKRNKWIKLPIPNIMTRSRYMKLLHEEKANIYRFNQNFVKISESFLNMEEVDD